MPADMRTRTLKASGAGGAGKKYFKILRARAGRANFFLNFADAGGAGSQKVDFLRPLVHLVFLSWWR